MSKIRFVGSLVLREGNEDNEGNANDGKVREAPELIPNVCSAFRRFLLKLVVDILYFLAVIFRTSKKYNFKYDYLRFEIKSLSNPS